MSHRHRPTDEKPSVSARPLDGITILLAEADPVERGLARETFARAGARVIEAGTGGEALARFEEAPIDVIVADADLPGLDGLGAMRRIRERRDERWRTPAIALSARGAPEDLRAAIVAGFDGHMAKPASWDELVAGVAHLARAPLLQLAG